MSIPIAAQATSSHISHVIRNTLVKVLVIDETHLDFVLKLIEGTTVKHLIVIDQQSQDQYQEYPNQEELSGVTVTSLSKLELLGNENIIERSDQVCESIIYVSKYRSYFD